MKFSKYLLIVIASALVLASCSSSGRLGGGKSGGCGCHRGMVGY